MRFNVPLQLDRLGEGIAEIHKEAERLTTERVSDDVLDGWKSFVEGSALLPGLTSLEAMNRQLLELPRNNLSAAYYAGAQQKLRDITPTQLQQAAQRLLRRDAMVWVIAGPAQPVARELAEVGLSAIAIP
jgi:predicted Zn-dependent peptidase